MVKRALFSTVNIIKYDTDIFFNISIAWTRDKQNCHWRSCKERVTPNDRLNFWPQIHYIANTDSGKFRIRKQSKSFLLIVHLNIRQWTIIYLTPWDQMCLLSLVSTRTSGVPIIFSANLRISLIARGALLLNPLQTKDDH